jgi:hypothetical protein
MARASSDRSRVKLWSIGISTMIATNGRELAPGLNCQFLLRKQLGLAYMIPAGPRVPPLAR